MRLRLINAPSTPVVTLAEAKAALRVDDVADDALIESYVAAAITQLDGRDGVLGRALVTQTWELVLPIFPAAQIVLPLPPLQSITAIKYRNAANVEITLDPAEYIIDADSAPAMVFPVTSWPSTYNTPNAVVIRFVAGYGAPALVPDPIKSAIKLRTQALYDNLKPDEAAGIDRASSALIFPYRLMLP